MSKSQLYLEGLPLITRRAVSLPDHSKLLREMRLLERQTHSGGRDSVDHARGSHDDLANCVFGVMRHAQQRKNRVLFSQPSMYGGSVTPAPLYEVTKNGLVELDRATGRPVTRSRLFRDADGKVKINCY